MKLTAVISGGQTGVDQAALRAGRAAKLEIGGWCPPGRISEDGAIPDEFPLRETPQERSMKAPGVPRSLRTEWNVRDADATLVLVPPGIVDDVGTNLTIEFADVYGRPILICDPADTNAVDSISSWLNRSNVKTLNVAGPSERAVPGIGEQVYELLTNVFASLAE